LHQNFFDSIESRQLYILGNTQSPLGVFDFDPENLENLRSDKTSLYNAAKEIFADVSEDYVNPGLILHKFFELKQSTGITNEHIVQWMQDIYNTFIQIDILGYDPLGYTDYDHQYHKNINVFELDTIKTAFPAQNNLLFQTESTDEEEKMTLEIFDRAYGTVIIINHTHF
jgi:hypothetical protein